MLPTLPSARARRLRPAARLLAAGLAGALAAALLAPAAGAHPAAPAAAPAAADARVAPRGIVHTWHDSQRQLRRGWHRGTKARHGALVIARPRGRRTRGGRRYAVATWHSPWGRPGFGLTELIASWNASTPGGTWIQVQVRVRNAGRTSSWDTLADWANPDGRVRRRSHGSQPDDLGRVAVDTWRSARAAGVRRWQLRVHLMRPVGSRATPRVDAIGAMVSRLPDSTPPTSSPGPGRGRSLAMPRWSQYTHSGHYPRWGGGGQAWCSPTSVSMVLGHYGRVVGRRAYRWIPRGHRQPWVDHAARYTYDHRYGGTGNWPFNTAYAALRGTKAFVTRLRSLREAEDFIVAGIPLVASIAYGSGELSNSPIRSSNGHLLVISGFTRGGDVIAHDPAGRGRGVRRVYDRGQFERLWLRASGGVVYVIRPRGTALPARGPRRNW